ncbi:hypothetical protein SEA_XIMENITA_60 [Mycobacterium phage Ximenita]|uniref:Uncharacterized protein n=1 Tax=Mycobacterium phage Ximenita TaxID=2708633 RepID=A0A6G6XS16_9CAUD|nr:secreted protein [Mycobacterium phage Ximenita]QIG61569.1 hypothetical protein SEA_XIMENITA_60 [Mycobacterium phage Ximenita]
MNRTLKGLAAAAAVVTTLTVPGCANGNQEWHSGCTVKAKDVLLSGSNGDTSRTKRLTTTCGSFDVEDAIEVGHFNSWDLWAQLEVGKTYDLFTGGPRIGFLSTFPIVLDVRPAK